MPKPFVFEFYPPIHAPASAAVIANWRNGKTVHTYGETFVGMLGVMANIEAARAALAKQLPVAQLPAPGDVEHVFQVGGYALDFEALQKSVARVLWSSWRRVGAPSQLPPLLPIPGGEDLGFLPAAWAGAAAVSVVGIAAVAGTTWWAIDRNEKVAEVKKFAASQAAAVDQYVQDLALRAAMGAPLPPPPEPVKAAQTSEKWLAPMQLVAGGLLGAGAVLGAQKAMAKPKRRRRNPAPPPARPRRRLRKKAAPKRKPSTTRTTKKTTTKRRTKTELKRKRNPQTSAAVEKTLRQARAKGLLKKGQRGGVLFYRWSDGRYEAMLVRFNKGGGSTPLVSGEGVSAKGAAVSLEHEIGLRRKRNPCGTKKKSPAKKKAAPKRTKKAAPKRTKKAAPKRKANPAPKGNTPRAKFIRGQMRKGRSMKQATADWNGKQRLAKQRKGKAKRRR